MSFHQLFAKGGMEQINVSPYNPILVGRITSVWRQFWNLQILLALSRNSDRSLFVESPMSPDRPLWVHPSCWSTSYSLAEPSFSPGCRQESSLHHQAWRTAALCCQPCWHFGPNFRIFAQIGQKWLFDSILDRLENSSLANALNEKPKILFMNCSLSKQTFKSVWDMVLSLFHRSFM